MKRSEFIAQRRAARQRRDFPVGYPNAGQSFEMMLSGAVGEDVGAAEAAGVIWDPEDQPSATLQVCDLHGPEGLCHGLSEPGRPGLMTLAEARLACDLYNRRGAIAEVARQLRSDLFLGDLRRNGNYTALGMLSTLADRLEGRD